MNEYEVYVITNTVNGKLYVGYTKKGTQRRFKQHVRSSETGSTYALHRAMRCYGSDKFTFEKILGNLNEQSAKHSEVTLIHELNSHVSKHGYNMTLGGDGFQGLSDDARKRIADAHRKENLKSSTIERMRTAKLGITLSHETRQKMSASHSGKKFSEEHRRKIGYANSSSQISAEKRKKLSKARSKQVNQMTLAGEYVQTFESINDASEQTGIHRTNISGCCCGTRSRAGGYMWKYAEQ